MQSQLNFVKQEEAKPAQEDGQEKEEKAAKAEPPKQQPVDVKTEQPEGESAADTALAEASSELACPPLKMAKLGENDGGRDQSSVSTAKPALSLEGLVNNVFVAVSPAEGASVVVQGDEIMRKVRALVNLGTKDAQCSWIEEAKRHWQLSVFEECTRHKEGFSEKEWGFGRDDALEDFCDFAVWLVEAWHELLEGNTSNRFFRFINTDTILYADLFWSSNSDCWAGSFIEAS